MSRPIKAFVVIYDTAELLPHFLRHYDRLGVSEFVIGLGIQPGDPLLDVVREHAKHYLAHIYWRTVRAGGIPDKGKIEEMLRTTHPTAPDDYAMWLDLDEFHEYPAPLSEIIAECDRQNIWAIQSRFLDRVAASGELLPLQPTPSIGAQYPMGCLLSERIGWGDCRKIMLLRGCAALANEGHHDTRVGCVDRWPIGKPWQYVVHHFKWNASVSARLADRSSFPSNGRYGAECRRLLEFISAHGRINLANPALDSLYCGELRYFA